MRACIRSSAQVLYLVDASALLVRVGAPQEEHERVARASEERLDRRVSELLPAAFAVRVGRVRTHCQDGVEQQHAYSYL